MLYYSASLEHRLPGGNELSGAAEALLAFSGPKLFQKNNEAENQYVTVMELEAFSTFANFKQMNQTNEGRNLNEYPVYAPAAEAPH